MKIVTDCAADMTAEELEQLSVTQAPLFIQFPDGEVIFVRPPFETTAPIGDLTVGTTATVEREVGQSAEVSDSLKAIWNVRRKRALQNATSLAVPTARGRAG